MKRFFTFMLIGAFLIVGLKTTAFAASTAETQTPATGPAVISAADIDTQFQTIVATLTDLAQQTQDATDQLNLNGIDTSKAQAALDVANAAIAKAKTTIDTLHYSVKTAQSQIQEAKNDILSTLSILKASLPTLNQIAQ